MKTLEIYMQFLELEKNIDKRNSLSLLNPEEKSILKHIALSNVRNERLGIKDMMFKSNFYSPSHMHIKIHSLVNKGWIYLQETEDGRRKQLQLTLEALKYFDKLGLAIKNIYS